MPGEALPLVTVVIPTHDRLPLLREAVESVRAQSYPHWELVVADDGSTDGSAEWVEGLADPRVRVLRLPHSGLPGVVRHQGVRAGSGELLAFLDSDDRWLPRRLEVQVQALRRSGARWSYSAYQLVDCGGEPLPTRAGSFHPHSGRIAARMLGDQADVCICTLLLERALYDQVGGFSQDPRLCRREDWELELRLAVAGEVVAVDEVLVEVRHHPGRTTADCSDAFLANAVAYELLLGSGPPPELVPLARRQRAWQLALHASARLEQGRYLAAAGFFLRALAARPGMRRWLGALHQGVDRRWRRRGTGPAR
jgi:glycosyltransferase involved in cell wall biosynthesis